MSDPIDHDAAIVALEARLANTSRAAQPLDWAVATYRLAMARAEAPTGSPSENLQSALGLYAQAAEVLTEQRAPVEHARVINAAGSAHRLLGNQKRAVELFERAEHLLDGRGTDLERAGVLSNLGLAHADHGSSTEAIAAFDNALPLLVGDDDDHRRARVATRHNLAQALMATGSSDDLETAIQVLEAADLDCAEVDAPLHQAMVWHSLGVARKGRAENDPERRAALLDQALEHFDRCLTIFTLSSFPFHHAVAKQNVGLTLAARGDIESSRLALASYESALSIFDPRLHRNHWQSTYSNMEALEARLAIEAPGQTKYDHFAALIGGMTELERLAELRRRLAQLERLPSRQRVERLGEMAHAAAQQSPRAFVAIIRTTIMVLMELPDDLLHSTLEAQLVAHARLDPHDRRSADLVLDEAINALLFGPQRIRVRDLLTELGWERP